MLPIEGEQRTEGVFNKMSGPLVSIITVVYNGANTIEKTILSIIQQTYKNIEYIIIDGNSKDSTLEIIKKYDSKISYWKSEPDKGLYDAMNKGIAASTGDYVWFINSGDLIDANDTLEKVVNQNSGADVFYSDTYVINENGEKIGLLSDLTHNNAPLSLTWKDMQRGMVVCHQSFIVKKSIAPLFDTKYRYSADIDWIIKCLKKAKAIVHSKTILSDFLVGGISQQQMKNGMWERYEILKNHFGLVKNFINHIFIAYRYFIKRKLLKQKKGLSA
jgi:glycosyltransferase involved in cell wall biosynthesis